MKKTVCVQIGNSDNKLSQQRWADYVEKFQAIFNGNFTVHFSGGSNPNLKWQNWCIVAEIPNGDEGWLDRKLGKLAVEFLQDTIAIFYGETAFISGDGVGF